MYDYSLSTAHESATDERRATIARIERKRAQKRRTIDRKRARLAADMLKGRK